MTTIDSRRAAVDALARLPLFQLSTAGMELFHTNMLYWLALHQPTESAPVWKALGLHSVRADGQDRSSSASGTIWTSCSALAVMLSGLNCAGDLEFQ